MLSSMPDNELIARLEYLRHAERAACTDILTHLNEVERRSLHLRRGYPSLFAYCTGYLRYSESAAARLVQAARSVRRFPRVSAMLESGEINLMTLGLVANLLSETTVDTWLDRIRGKTQRQVEAIASTVRPPVTLRDRARLVHVAVPRPSPLPLAPVSKTTADASTPPAPALGPPSDSSPSSGTRPGPGTPAGASAESGKTGDKGASDPMVTKPRVYIQFLADQSFMAKYRTAAALLSNRLSRLTFESVFTALIEDFIRRHGPVERHQRRERAAARGAVSLRTSIPRGTRDAVFSRDCSRCTYVGSDGKRCDETIHLHVDHIKPVARGGTNDIANLRLLCARHNRLQAEKILGREEMRKFSRTR